MENKINIAELLKNVPKGTKLYSPLCGECELAEVGYGCIALKDTDGLLMHFFEEGNYRRNGECMIFPSKENRDWSTFKRPFKNGDVIVSPKGNIALFSHTNSTDIVYYHCILKGFYTKDNLKIGIDCGIGCEKYCYLDSNKQKEYLFNAIEENGYKWNDVTKTLEKLVKPNFKVGNKITNGDNTITIKEITLNHYVDEHNRNWSISKQDEWELIPDKFDISTLKPFDKVLVRDGNDETWVNAFFGFRDPVTYKTCTFVTGNENWCQCIPYEGNEYLLGTTDNCDDFYKNW